jgi:hypothetical protein
MSMRTKTDGGGELKDECEGGGFLRVGCGSCAAAESDCASTIVVERAAARGLTIGCVLFRLFLVGAGLRSYRQGRGEERRGRQKKSKHL